MISIEIEYRRLFKLRKKTFSIAGSWNELTPEQFVMIANVADLSDEDFVYRLSNIPKRLVKQLTEWQRFNIIEAMSFIESDDPISFFIIKEAAFLEAPDDKLSGVSFGRFVFIDTYFTQYLAKQDPDTLNKFIGVLYCPEEFNDKQIAYYAVLAADVNRNRKNAILLNYKMVREWFTAQYPYVFPKGKEGEKSKDSGSWITVFDAVVGDDIIHQQEYANLPVSNVMRFLNTKIKENGKR